MKITYLIGAYFRYKSFSIQFFLIRLLINDNNKKYNALSKMMKRYILNIKNDCERGTIDISIQLEKLGMSKEKFFEMAKKYNIDFKNDGNTKKLFK